MNKEKAYTDKSYRKAQMDLCDVCSDVMDASALKFRGICQT